MVIILQFSLACFMLLDNGQEDQKTLNLLVTAVL